MKSKDLKVTLIHDWLTGMRGGEKVLELFCQRFPHAPIHTLLYVKNSVSTVISSHPVSTSLLQYLPLSFSKYRHYLPFFPFFAETSKVKNADLVISSSHAVAKAMIQRKGARSPLHICYIHTPMRYVWDRFDDYFGPARVGWLFSHLFFRPIAKLLQIYDLRTVSRVDAFIANSRFVADRVKRIYNREAFIVAPPVDLSLFKNTSRAPRDWFLVVSALVPYKRTEQAIEACAALNKKLVVVGSGPEEKSLKKLAQSLGAKVEFLGFVKGEDLAALYCEGQALLFPGVEDFGIVPVEAIAAGCPVIALKEGGILDSMTADTAVFYDEPSTNGLIGAMKQFEERQFETSKLKNRAQEFSHQAFLAKFEKIMNHVLEQND